MPSLFWSSLRLLVACFMVSLFAFCPPNLAAQSHVVNPSDLQHATMAASQARQADMDRLNEFFSSPIAQKALNDAHVNAAQVKTGLASLSDQELGRLAARADKAQKDFAAGSITDHMLLLIVIAIIVVVVIIIAVKV